MSRILITLAFLFASLLGGITPALAADKAPQFQFQPIVSVPLPTGSGAVDSSTSLTSYLNAVFGLTIAIAAILGVIMITFDGFKYMASDVVGKKQAAMEGLQGAAMGLILLLLAYVILHVINPNILNLDALTKDLTMLGSFESDARTTIPATSEADCKKQGGTATKNESVIICTVPTVSQAAEVTVACTQFKNPRAVPTGASCERLMDVGYSRINNQCCPALAEGYQCCALPK
ncbi:MAG: pilin [Patescibacteria group bacterium]